MEARLHFATVLPDAFGAPHPDAPILKQADAAIMGDPAEVEKELAEALSKN